jgi:hypothetical protein
MNTTTNTATAAFQIGATYNTGRAADYVWTFTVIARTAKFITLEDKYGEVTRVGVKLDGGREWALPLGSYSMAPVISSDRPGA